MNKDNVKRFETLFSEINRPGAEKLLGYIKKSDFYTAPASTRYHSCHEGGLLEHTLNVHDCLMAKCESETWKPLFDGIDKETFTIVSLLHDICKTNFYGTELRNKKVYSDRGKKIDSQGRYDWETVNAYTVEDKFPYGHGEKSVMMVEEYMKLKPIERYAIRWHMGFTEPKESWNTLSSAIRIYPLVLALHEADLEATYLLEKEE